MLYALVAQATGYSTFYGEVISTEVQSVNGSLTFTCNFYCDTTTYFQGNMQFSLPAGWSASALLFNGVLLYSNQLPLYSIK